MRTLAKILIIVAVVLLILATLASLGIKNLKDWVQEKPENVEQFACSLVLDDINEVKQTNLKNNLEAVGSVNPKSECVYYMSFRYKDTSSCDETLDPEFCNSLAQEGYSSQHIRFEDQEVRRGVFIYGVILDIDAGELEVIVRNNLDRTMSYGLNQDRKSLSSSGRNLKPGQAGHIYLPAKFDFIDNQYIIKNMYVETIIDGEHYLDKLELVADRLAEDDLTCKKALTQWGKIESVDVCVKD